MIWLMESLAMLGMPGMSPPDCLAALSRSELKRPSSPSV